MPMAWEHLATFGIGTVVSSPVQRQQLMCWLRRMWALTKSGGAVLWYDLGYDNPRNPDVKGLSLPRIRALFPEGQMIAWRITLAPPLARLVARIHPSLYAILDAIPLLRSHWLCWIQKP